MNRANVMTDGSLLRRGSLTGNGGGRVVRQIADMVAMIQLLVAADRIEGGDAVYVTAKRAAPVRDVPS